MDKHHYLGRQLRGGHRRTTCLQGLVAAMTLAKEIRIEKGANGRYHLLAKDYESGKEVSLLPYNFRLTQEKKAEAIKQFLQYFAVASPSMELVSYIREHIAPEGERGF